MRTNLSRVLYIEMPLTYRIFIACASKETFTVRLALFNVLTKILQLLKQTVGSVNVTFIICTYRSFLVCEAHN